MVLSAVCVVSTVCEWCFAARARSAGEGTEKKQKGEKKLVSATAGEGDVDQHTHSHTSTDPRAVQCNAVSLCVVCCVCDLDCIQSHCGVVVWCRSALSLVLVDLFSLPKRFSFKNKTKAIESNASQLTHSLTAVRRIEEGRGACMQPLT